jgi:hypothetical protein
MSRAYVEMPDIIVVSIANVKPMDRKSLPFFGRQWTGYDV